MPDTPRRVIPSAWVFGKSRNGGLVVPEIGTKTVKWVDPETGYEYTMRISVAKREPKPLYRNKGWLETQYIGHGRTMQSIADQFGLSAMSICKWLHKFNIPTRPRGRARPGK